MELACAHSRSTSGILRSLFVVGFCVRLARSGKSRRRECVYGFSRPLPEGSRIAGAQRQLGALVRDRRGDHGDRGRRWQSRGIGSFTPTEGLRALQQLIKQDYTQTAVIPFDLNRWRESHSLSGNSAFLREAPHGERQQAGSKQSLGKRCRRPPRLRDRRLWTPPARFARISYPGKRTAGSSTFGLRRRFAPGVQELGLDSLTAFELCNRLESGLKLTLSPTLIWNYPNIALLAAHLADMMKISLNDAVRRRRIRIPAWRIAKS